MNAIPGAPGPISVIHNEFAVFRALKIESEEFGSSEQPLAWVHCKFLDAVYDVFDVDRGGVLSATLSVAFLRSASLMERSDNVFQFITSFFS